MQITQKNSVSVAILLDTFNKNVEQMKLIVKKADDKKDNETSDFFMLKYAQIESFFLNFHLRYDTFSFFNSYNLLQLTADVFDGSEVTKFILSLSDNVSVKMAVEGLEIDSLIDETVKGVLATKRSIDISLISEEMKNIINVDEEKLRSLFVANVWLLFLYLIKVYGAGIVFVK